MTLGVVDLQRTEDFYREVLLQNPEHSQVDQGEPEFLLLRCAGSCIVFRPLQLLEAQHPAVLQNLTRQPLGVGLQIEFSCTELTAIRHAIEHFDWPVCYELEDEEHQRSELWLHDPDGYLIVLNQERQKRDV